MIDTAQRLFDKLIIESDLLSLAASETETLHLDFKEATQGALADKSKRRDFERVLAKAISGFANANGGVLVIGVDDKTRTLAPFNELASLEEFVNEQASRLVSFPVPGIHIRAIPTHTDDTKGFVVMLVPASDLAPHRSQKDHRYYRRSGESFVPMEHYEVADMFGRRSFPSLSVVLSAATKFDTKFQVTVALMNRGRTIAKFPSIELLTLSSPYQVSKYGVDDNGTFGLPPAGIGSHKQFHGGANDVIHAMGTKPIFRVVTEFARNSLTIHALRMTLAIAAEGLPMRTLDVDLSIAELEQQLDNAATGITLHLET